MLYGTWTKEEIRTMYEDAVKLAAMLGLPAPIPPTESCAMCGRKRYGWCECPTSEV